MKRICQIIGVALVTTGLLCLCMDFLYPTTIHIPYIVVTPEIPVTASYSPVEVVERTEPIKVSIEKPKRVYDGVSLPDELIDYVEDRCGELEISPELVFAIMKSESHGLWVEGDWSEDLQRYRSIGYFQIRDVNWGRLYDQYGIDCTTRTGNLDAGVVMIKELCDKYGHKDICQIVTSYKCGEYRGEELVSAGIVLDCVDEVMMTYAEYLNED